MMLLSFFNAITSIEVKLKSAKTPHLTALPSLLIPLLLFTKLLVHLPVCLLTARPTVRHLLAARTATELDRHALWTLPAEHTLGYSLGALCVHFSQHLTQSVVALIC